MPAAIFEWAYLAGFVIAILIRVPYGRKHRPQEISRRRREYVVWGFMALWGVGQLAAIFYVVTPWLAFADFRLPWWTGMAGVVLFSLALILLWRSHADLGRNWSATLEIRQGHQLVTHGTYRFVRHPMYAAHWLWALAQPLLLWNWIAGFGSLLAFVPLYVLRVGQEEQLMLEEFRDEYRQYMSRTGRVFPRLWSN